MSFGEKIGTIIGLVTSAFVIVFWFEYLCQEKLYGHRRTSSTDNSGSDSPASDGAGAPVAGAGTSLYARTFPHPGVGAAAHRGAPVTSMGNGNGHLSAIQKARDDMLAQMAQLAAQNHTVPIGMLQAYQQVSQQLAMQGPFGPGLGSAFARMPPAPKPIEHGGIKLGEITAYRVWLLAPNSGGYLKSCHLDSVWAPGEAMTGDIGKDGHGKGVHAWKTKALMLQYGLAGTAEAFVVGSVRLWGEVVEHERGYRAQYAVIASIDDLVAPGYELKAVADTLAHVRAKYGLTQ